MYPTRLSSVSVVCGEPSVHGFEEEMLESGFLKNEEMKLVHYVDRFSEATTLFRGLTK